MVRNVYFLRHVCRNCIPYELPIPGFILGVTMDIGNPFEFVITSIFILVMIGVSIVGLSLSIYNWLNETKERDWFVPTLWLILTATLSSGWGLICLRYWLVKYLDIQILW